MTEALHLVLCDPAEVPDQANRAIKAQLFPFCVAAWQNGVQRLAVTVMPEPDAKSIQQRRYYHGVVLVEIAEQAKANGQRFPMPVWKEYFRDKYVGYDWVVYRNPITGKKSRRKVRKSTEDMGVRAYSKLIEQVTAEAVTELGVMFSVPRWEEYR
jgi:hypothetical protein